MKNNNNSDELINVDLLSTVYLCEQQSLKKYSETEQFAEEDIKPFIANYINSGYLNFFTRGNNKYMNTRAIMHSIDIEQLKRELFAMLVANGKYNRGNTRIIKKKTGSYVSITPAIENLFCDADANTIEYLFSELYNKMPEELNEYIDEKLEEMIKEKAKLTKEYKKEEESWLSKSYYEFNEYDLKDLRIIENVRKGKRHLKVIGVRPFKAKIDNKVKKLEKEYGRTY